MDGSSRLGKVVLLGGGPTALGAAYRLQQHSIDDWVIVESSDHLGGLAASFCDEYGFTWDVGGHVEFSHYEEYDRFTADLFGNDRVWHERKAWVHLADRVVPYPFQYNLHRLGPEDRERSVDGLKNAATNLRSGTGPATNFLDWIYKTFGPGIAEIFMVPYNKKVWGYPLELLGHSWIADRIAVPDLSRGLKATRAATDETTWGPNERFWYPSHGGTGETWRRLATKLNPTRIQLGIGVVGIDLHARTLALTEGQGLEWDTLITTIPLDVFCALCVDLPLEIQAAASSLLYSTCHVVGIGLREPTPECVRNTTWMYFPCEESPYHRVTVLSNYSPNNAPPGCWSLLAEVCETQHRPLKTKNLIGDVIAAMKQDGLITDRNEVISRWKFDALHGYPTPFLGRDRILNEILPFLEARRVYSRGRFGGWKYEVSNQDHSFMQGVELVERLLGIGEEITLFYPQMVNRRR